MLSQRSGKQRGGDSRKGGVEERIIMEEKNWNTTSDTREGDGAPAMGRLVSRRGFFIAGLAAAGAIGALGGFGLVGCSSGSGTESSTRSYDIVIVGTGGAGLSSAISAYDAGVTDICLLEKMNGNGGNTNFSSSGMNASETKFQKAQGITDSNELFAQETYDGGYDTANRELVDYMCDHSAAAIDWLDGLGITLDNLSMTGGMSVKRCHRPTDGSAVGLTLVPGLVAQVEARNISIKIPVRATALLVADDGTVTGVKVEDGDEEYDINAKAVILATGGLGSSKEMIAKYRPDLVDYISTNQPGATGDGYVMAEDIGAELIQMDQIQIHPTVEQTTATLIAEGVRGSGAILVNSEGKRFFDEMSTRDKVSAAELAQTDAFAWEVFDEQVYKANKAVTSYDNKGLVQTGSSTVDLAGKIGVDAVTLQSTIDSYNAITTSGVADAFSRTQGLIAFADGKMYGIKVAPGIHHEMGGIRIDTTNEALRADGTAISGLYAAGEVTGGIHGNNRIGGNAVCDITVFGKNVGEVVAGSLS